MSKQTTNKKLMLVRHGRMANIGWFEHEENTIPKTPKPVVIKTDKGLEIGTIIGPLTSYKGGTFRFDPQNLKDYYENQQADLNENKIGKFVRYATAEDLSEQKHMEKIAKEEMKFCQKLANEMNLGMKVIDSEHIFGGERVVFYFMAEGRIDFRQLVKRLAHEYQTRIEMRQIGSRDEAKLLGDYETCGQQCCCQKFLQILKPVNMRMAKVQKATLDPAKISGYCGRLKCCLRYEDETYTCLKKRLPKKNTIVTCEHGKGRVIDTQIITQLVTIELESNERIAVGVEDIEIIDKPRGGGGKKPAPCNKNCQRNDLQNTNKNSSDRNRNNQNDKPDTDQGKSKTEESKD